MKKLFSKEKTERLLDTAIRVTEEAGHDETVDMLEQIKAEEDNRAFKEWMKGFGAGTVSSIGGVVIGTTLALVVNKMNEK